MSDIWHILSRGVDKRIIFLDDEDRFRFIHDLFEFNDQNPVSDVFYTFNKSNKSSWDFVSPKIEKKPRKLLVDIYAFCIMSNHYHLLLSPLVENGVTQFMRKLNIGYAKYFNEKYDRTGALFEGRYKSIIIKNDAHFLYLPFYIHCNPLDIIDIGWRTGQLRKYNEAIKFLENYRWSSHLDYLGKKNFPSVINQNMLLDIFGGRKNYEKAINQWLSDMKISKQIQEMNTLLLEK